APTNTQAPSNTPQPTNTTAPGQPTNTPAPTNTQPPPSADRPVLISPANGSTTNTRSPLFQWTAVSGASSYRIQVSEAPTFATQRTNRSVSTTSYGDSTYEVGKVFYWRVRASWPDGTVGEYSDAWVI